MQSLLLFLLLSFGAPIFKLVILRRIVPGWNAAWFMVKESWTSCLVDFAWVTQEWTCPGCSTHCSCPSTDLSSRWTLIDIFKASNQQPRCPGLPSWSSEMVKWLCLICCQMGSTDSVSDNWQCACSSLGESLALERARAHWNRDSSFWGPVHYTSSERGA